MLVSWLLIAMVQAAPAGWSARELWEAWPRERFVPETSACLRHEGLVRHLEALQARYPDDVRLEVVGHSVEGRPIHLLTIGRGRREVLLWSQMHGDEPSATPALLDLADFLLSRREESDARAVLDELTLRMVPMLNPDGAERYRRRNAQGIDINRDALNLATPEGRLLKRLRDEHEPMLGFNLHDQNRRTVVGDTGVLASNAVLAVAGDAEGTVTPGRRRAMRACSAIVEALRPFVGRGVARYDEDWSPRAFGDNLTRWGTPVVLLESGGPPGGGDLAELTRLNFVALLRVLVALARDDLAGYDESTYRDLPRNQSDRWADVVVRGGRVFGPRSGPPFRADLAFNLVRPEREAAGCTAPTAPARSVVTELGDCRFVATATAVEASSALLVPALAVTVDGYGARRWLDRSAVDRLGRLGVGWVRWRVPPSRVEAAKRHAAALRGPGRSHVTVAASGRTNGGLPLRQAPRDGVRASSLGEALERLGIATPGSTGELFAHGGLERGGPASFVLLRPHEDAGSFGFEDLLGAELEAVWIDGVAVPAATGPASP